MIQRSKMRPRRQGGLVNIMLLFILSLIVLIPMCGLAVDTIMMYVVRTRLQSAADAAALAAGRALNVNQPLASQSTYAQGRATAFFNANFPSGYMLSSNPTVVVDPPFYGTGTNARVLYTTVHGQADAPLFFMRYLISNTTTVKVIAQSARRDINLIMVLDTSGSMSGTPCTTMKSAAQNFVNYFSPGRDTIGLVTFDGAYSIDYAPAKTFMSGSPNLQGAIAAITCGGNTGTAQALNKAYNLITGIGQPSALNVLVFFTDGQPNGVTATFPIRRGADNRYGDGVSSTPSGCPNNSTTVTCNYPASTCANTSNTVTGYVAEWNGGPASTGVTAGVGGITNEAAVTSPGNCYFNTNETSMRRDVAYIPSTDIYGNATSGYKTDFVLVNPVANSYYSAGRDTFPTGHPYAAKIRPDVPGAVANASLNAADAQGATIRADSTYDILIYSIGLGGNPGYPPDTDFMVRMSNVPSAVDPYTGATVTNSKPYDANRPQGMFVYVTDPNQLNQAFAQLASSILRLNQ